ncbi:YifB family Mg chelatase-like AAA ATPase [Anaerococcus murdochii]|uniref:YifB family Mg chelatase-like AAA ATPase n=1 Tax=Anaerococcus murdochii TaxID=411577 RepID=A0ABS7SWD9_9FIRM|nr:YifB family Mg chelatase-like AAA ATPase [Anaerococcus murdochii]MBZ2385857.1 YifB family Mg chelatase-like AAA ATPase [Anaerococcus murdochii]
MYSKTNTTSLIGLEGKLVEVESDITSGMPAFNIVGLPDSSIKESKDRVRVALVNSSYKFPAGRITINLSPADLKKEGTQLDLPIAISLLSSMGVIDRAYDDYIFLGELSLDGRILPIRGALAMVISMREQGFRKFIISEENKEECAIISDIEVYPFNKLNDVVAFLNGDLKKDFYKINPALLKEEISYDLDFKDLKGQENLKRALQIAAAGGHNLLMVGPPGSGKTFSAKHLPTILPDMSFEERVEVTKIYSIMGLLDSGHLVSARPFRAPHHSSSQVALIGGGHSVPKPGEITLAHRGVLFLDEFPEYQKNVIEALREPLENKEINVARAQASVKYPSDFILIAAMNPCPCGNYGNPLKECTCSINEIRRYLNKISSPILDRIDIHIEIKPVKYDDLNDDTKSKSSAELKSEVVRAREIQAARYKDEKIKTNALLSTRQMKKYIKLSPEVEKIGQMAFNKYNFSVRSYNKILKMARTIADLEASEEITSKHLLEAVRYRSLDDKYWSV